MAKGCAVERRLCDLARVMRGVFTCGVAHCDPAHNEPRLHGLSCMFLRERAHTDFLDTIRKWFHISKRNMCTTHRCAALMKESQAIMQPQKDCHVSGTYTCLACTCSHVAQQRQMCPDVHHTCCVQQASLLEHPPAEHRASLSTTWRFAVTLIPQSQRICSCSTCSHADTGHIVFTISPQTTTVRPSDGTTS